MNKLKIISSSFKDGEYIPEKHTGKKGVSPAFEIENLSTECQSIAIIMDDLDVPFTKEYTHWIIWNISPTSVVPEAIEPGPIVENLGNAFQGVAYGKNKYKGPNPPIFARKPHRYIFRFYALDTKLDLIFSAEKSHLMKAMKGHVLQTGTMTGIYKKR